MGRAVGLDVHRDFCEVAIWGGALGGPGTEHAGWDQDLFGVKGRQWLASLELAPEERESVDAAMRRVEFLVRRSPRWSG